MILTEINIDWRCKNIIAVYTDEETGFTSRRGFSPQIAQDWDDIDLDVNLKPYKDLAWEGLARPEPMEEIIIVDEHE